MISLISLGCQVDAGLAAINTAPIVQCVVWAKIQMCRQNFAQIQGGHRLNVKVA
jgi:hypothetical protein